MTSLGRGLPTRNMPLVEVDAENFAEVAAEVKRLLLRPEKEEDPVRGFSSSSSLGVLSFVSFDLEMSGVQGGGGRGGLESLEERGDTCERRYKKMRGAAKEFGIVQVGIALFFEKDHLGEGEGEGDGPPKTRDSGGVEAKKESGEASALEEHFDRKAFNFFVFPRAIDAPPNIRIVPRVSVCAESVSFLCSHGVDVGRWMQKGVTYCSAAVERLLEERFVEDEEVESVRGKKERPGEKKGRGGGGTGSQKSSGTERQGEAGGGKGGERYLEAGDRRSGVCGVAWDAEVSALFASGASERVLPDGFGDLPENRLKRFLRRSSRARSGGKFLSVERRKEVSTGVKKLMLCQLTEIEKREETEKREREKREDVEHWMGFRSLWKTLVSSCRSRNVPFVFHNGLLDLLFLLEHFEEPLPEEWEEFKRLVGTLMPVVLDTKTIAVLCTEELEACVETFRGGNGGTGLQSLCESLLGGRQKREGGGDVEERDGEAVNAESQKGEITDTQVDGKEEDRPFGGRESTALLTASLQPLSGVCAEKKEKKTTNQKQGEEEENPVFAKKKIPESASDAEECLHLGSTHQGDPVDQAREGEGKMMMGSLGERETGALLSYHSAGFDALQTGRLFARLMYLLGEFERLWEFKNLVLVLPLWLGDLSTPYGFDGKTGRVLDKTRGGEALTEGGEGQTRVSSGWLERRRSGSGAAATASFGDLKGGAAATATASFGDLKGGAVLQWGCPSSSSFCVQPGIREEDGGAGWGFTSSFLGQGGGEGRVGGDKGEKSEVSVGGRREKEETGEELERGMKYQTGGLWESKHGWGDHIADTMCEWSGGAKEEGVDGASSSAAEGRDGVSLKRKSSFFSASAWASSSSPAPPLAMPSSSLSRTSGDKHVLTAAESQAEREGQRGEGQLKGEGPESWRRDAAKRPCRGLARSSGPVGSLTGQLPLFSGVCGDSLLPFFDQALILFLSRLPTEKWGLDRKRSEGRLRDILRRDMEERECAYTGETFVPRHKFPLPDPLFLWVDAASLLLVFKKAAIMSEDHRKDIEVRVQRSIGLDRLMIRCGSFQDYLKAQRET